MRSTVKHPLDQVLIEIGSIDKYCTASQESSSTLSLILKELYDRAVIDSRKRVGPLLTLSVNGLDDETIWEQLQTRNKPLVRFSTKIVKRLKRRLDLAPLREDSNDTEDASIEADSDSDGFEHADGAGASDDEMSQDDLLQADEDEEGDFDEENDDYVQSDEDMHEMEDGGGVTVTGDSEDDMEAFLDAEDEKEMRRFFKEDKKGKDKQINDDASSDDDGGDADELAFVQQHMYGDGSDDDDEEVGADYKFSDFFVAEKAERRKATQRETKTQQKRRPTGSDESLDGEVSEGGEGRGNNDTSSAPSGEEDDGEDWEEEEEEEGGGESTGHNASTKAVAGGSKATPTPLQQRKAVLSTQIASLEEELIASKPWELRGEVKAADRPENSFLSLHADIERTSKPAPIVTQSFTSSMEDMIRRRIKEANFSDVLPPKQAKTDEPTAVDDLSQEKNKLGLGEVYAEEFLAKSLNAQPEAVSRRLEQDRIDAQDLFHKISRQLDALSHFHFTPRPVVPESRVSTLNPHAGAGAAAVSSLLLEDVTPATAQGSISQLAPEEVFGKKRGLEASLKSTEELTSDDRQRQRRASKAANKAKKSRALDEKAVSGAATGPAAARERAREEEKALDDQLRRDSRVLLTTAGPGSPSNKKAKTSSAISAVSSGSGDVSFSKSSSFFSNLQQESASLIKKKTATSGAKSTVKNPFAHSSSSLKL